MNPFTPIKLPSQSLCLPQFPCSKSWPLCPLNHCTHCKIPTVCLFLILQCRLVNPAVAKLSVLACSQWGGQIIFAPPHICNFPKRLFSIFFLLNFSVFFLGSFIYRTKKKREMSNKAETLTGFYLHLRQHCDCMVQCDWLRGLLPCARSHPILGNLSPRFFCVSISSLSRASFNLTKQH